MRARREENQEEEDYIFTPAISPQFRNGADNIRSFALNSEVSVLIYDSDVVAKLSEVQQRYFATSGILDRDQWDQRPLRSKLVQNIARMADALL